jgi:hypothetical protein
VARDTQAKLQKVHDALIKAGNLADDILELKASIPNLDLSIQETKSRKDHLLGEVRESNLKHGNIFDALSNHERIKPNIFSQLFRTKTAKNWRSERKKVSAQLCDCEAELKNKQKKLDHLERDLTVRQSKLATTQANLGQIKAEHRELSEIIKNACSEVNAPVPDSTFFNGTHEEIQIAHLWFEKASNIERDCVFEAAMAVHRAFVDCAANPLRQNLSIFTESFGTRSLGTPKKDQLISDLWSTFFLVVPVVSTTFASVHRLFSRLDPNTLGWLLVDEAGQAAPQAAVGAIMRSKRVVAVGDPLQIEPVVTLPNTLTEEICAFFGVDALTYNAPEASVQTLADAASPYCTRFPVGSGHRNVGSPLLVHRRCDSPMFDISNEIAYSNLMVQAKKFSGEHLPLGPSRWFDVVGKPGPDKWCADEAIKLIELLKVLRTEGAAPDVYIITPFVIVQDKLRKQLTDCGALNGWVDNPHQWVTEHVGTVHTVQGREAETVFFVLGAQAPPQSGARSWAGNRPNLVNVAVTRAKSSFYVIGNRGLWRSVGVFTTLDRLLA